MKKKIITLLALVLLVIAVSTVAVFASADDKQGENSTTNHMFDDMRSYGQQAHEKCEITEEKVKKLDDTHFIDMEKHHEENGTGHCGGSDLMSAN